MRPRTADTSQLGAAPELADMDIVERVLDGDTALFEILMRRYNQRLFRTVRVMVPSDHEAEDILQETYVRAYRHLRQYQARAHVFTWLARIAFHEVLARRRTRNRFTSLEDHESGSGTILDGWHDDEPTPEEHASSSELRVLLEQAIQRMPETLRLVFLLREVEGLDTQETADCLGISAGAVKVRLFRARAVLRDRIDRGVGTDLRRLHPFDGERCNRIVSGVVHRLEHHEPGGRSA
jgi:RNA polymerase sigma-70 factor (ECF subfamily)